MLNACLQGNWRREDETAPILLTKSCHDIDWLKWIVGAKCVKVSSFGSLKHFRKEQQPEGASSRCLDCKVCLHCAGILYSHSTQVEQQCPYSAKKIYLDAVKRGVTGWPVKILVEGTPTEENITRALETGPYGRCVYESDNDVRMQTPQYRPTKLTR